MVVYFCSCSSSISEAALAVNSNDADPAEVALPCATAGIYRL